MTTTDSFVLDGRGFEISVNGLTNFFGIGLGICGGQAEADVQRVASTAFTYKRLSCFVSTNTNTNNQNMISRNNGVNGNQAVAVVSGGTAHTGWLDDSTHTDSVASGDKPCIEFNSTGAVAIKFTATAATVEATTPYSMFALGTPVGTSASTTGASFFSMSGAQGVWATLSSEDHRVQTLVRAGGTLKYLQCFVGSSGGGVTVTSRKNTAAGNQTLSTTASTLVDDTTHTDSVAAGDKINYKAGGAMTHLWWMGCDMLGTTSAQDVVNSLGSGDGSNTTTVGTSDQWFAINQAGGFVSSTNKLWATSTLWYAVTASKFRCDLNANTESNATSFEFYNNGASGNQTVAVSAAATGAFEDSTHTDSVAAGHTAAHHYVSNAGSGSITPNWFAMLIDDGSVSGASTETGTVVLAFGPIAFAGAGSSSHTGSGILAFGPIAFAGAGSDRHTGTGVLAFGPIAFSAAGTVKHTGTGVLAFGPIAISALGARSTGAPSALNPAVPSAPIQLQPLTWDVPIVDPKTGFPAPEFMKKWSKQFLVIQKQFEINQTIIPKTYIDKQDVSTLQAAQTFALTQDGITLTAAKAYTDAQLAARILLATVVGSLPAAGTAGRRAFVTDSTQTLAAGIGSAVVGGGGNKVPVYDDGSTWLIG